MGRTTTSPWTSLNQSMHILQELMTVFNTRWMAKHHTPPNKSSPWPTCNAEDRTVQGWDQIMEGKRSGRSNMEKL
eukprot:7909601-Ditylum_brightwellii.AAC.1